MRFKAAWFGCLPALAAAAPWMTSVEMPCHTAEPEVCVTQYVQVQPYYVHAYFDNNTVLSIDEACTLTVTDAPTTVVTKFAIRETLAEHGLLQLILHKDPGLTSLI